MKLNEYLTAHEGEEGLPEKLNAEFLAEQGVELIEDELNNVAGGKRYVDFDMFSVVPKDSSNPTH